MEAPKRWQRLGIGLLPWLPRLALLAVSMPALVLLYYIFWARLSYPLDLEWMESGMLMHAKRVLDGNGLYVAPSVDFTSFCYPPLYPLLLGWLGKVFGLSYTLGRALSVLAFTATLALILRGAVRGAVEAAPQRCGVETKLGERPSGDAVVFAVVAMAAVAVAFPWTGAWYDLVRIDGLFLALACGGLYALAVGHRRARGVVIAGVLLGLAYYAKQTAVLFIVAAGLAQLLLRARLLPVLVAVVGAVAGLGTLLANQVTDGWFWFFVYDLHQAHQTDPTVLWSKAPALLWDKLGWLYLACVASAVLWCGAAVLRRRLAPHGPVWLLGGLAGVAAAVVGRATQWSHDNAYIPGVVFPAAFLAVSAAETRGLLAPRDADAALGGWRQALLGRPLLLRSLAWVPVVLAAIQVLATGSPEPRKHVPDARSRQEARRFLAELKRLGQRGEVLVPYHPYYSVLAGGRGHGHIMNVNDVNYTRKRDRKRSGGLFGQPEARRKRVLAARRKLLASIRRALGSDRFVAVIHDRSLVSRWIRRGDRAVPRVNWAYASQLPGLRLRFRPTWDLAWLRAAPRTFSGNPTAPRFVWERPQGARPPAGGRVVFDFEHTELPRWTVQGTAFGRGPVDGLLWDPKRQRAQGLVAGAGGRRWISSFHGGDAATGRLVSPPFVLDRPVLGLRVGGGRDAERLVVRLKVDGRIARQATGHNTERFRQVRWDVEKWIGRSAVLELVDASSGPWGHLQLDEVWLLPRANR
ncbi:MAG: hypothetical protein ABI333_13280 [bacterium]